MQRRIQEGDILELVGIKNHWPAVRIIVYVKKNISPFGEKYTVWDVGGKRTTKRKVDGFPVHLKVESLSEEWGNFEVRKEEMVYGLTFRKEGLCILHLYDQKDAGGRSCPAMYWRQLVDEEWLKWKMLAER